MSSIIEYDNGNEFLGHDFKNQLIKNEYVIIARCKTTENWQ